MTTINPETVKAYARELIEAEERGRREVNAELLAACKEALRILPLAMDSDLDFDAKTKAEYIARYPLIVQLKAAINNAERQGEAMAVVGNRGAGG